MTRWTQTTFVFLIAFVSAQAVCFLICRLVLKRLWHDDFWRARFRRTCSPVQLALMAVALSAAANAVTLPTIDGRLLRHLLLIAFIACATWLLKTALGVAQDDP